MWSETYCALPLVGGCSIPQGGSIVIYESWCRRSLCFFARTRQVEDVSWVFYREANDRSLQESQPYRLLCSSPVQAVPAGCQEVSDILWKAVIFC